jgi:hypothetical protein
MNFYLSLILLFSFSLSAFSQQSKPKQGSYRSDAEQLAARLLEKNETVEEIPVALIDSMENILLLVANFDHPKAQVVSQKFNIHTRAICDVHNFHFVAETNTPWVKNFIKNQKATPDVFRDIFAAYSGLSISLTDSDSDYCEFNFHSDNAMNMSFFAREISKLKGIDMVLLGGNDQSDPQMADIQLRRIMQGWVVSYYFRTGSSHEEQYYWQFGVTDAGEVRFLGEYGAAMPPDYQAQAGAVIYHD